jgi:hypothetical protein
VARITHALKPVEFEGVTGLLARFVDDEHVPAEADHAAIRDDGSGRGT